MKFESEVTRAPHAAAANAAVVTLRGKVVLGEASQSLRSTVEQLCTEGSPNIVLNLAGVTFMDSAGLGSLTLGFAKAKAAGGMLKLAAVQPRVKDALEITRLTRMFFLYETAEEALASFTGSEPGIEAPAR